MGVSFRENWILELLPKKAISPTLVDTLLKNPVHVGSKPAFVDFLDGEKERNARPKTTTNAANTTYNDSEIH